uniref:J domain-containing protein n=1 Tax=Strigamia maritima TaxID=126957 RepID=T1JFU1_STRMM
MAAVIGRALLAAAASAAAVHFFRSARRQRASGIVQLAKFNVTKRGLQLSSSIRSNESERMCWKCQSVIPKQKFVCSECQCLQSPDSKMNHFQLFEMEEKFDVDVHALTNRFKNLQRKFHPDKFAGKSRVERDHSALYSAQINKAYQTLLKPLQRGLYILELRGRPLVEESVTMSADFLMEIMEINEALVDADADVESTAKVEEIASKNAEKIDKSIENLSSELKSGNWDAAQKTLAELKYYTNIEEKAKSIVNRRELLMAK